MMKHTQFVQFPTKEEAKAYYNTLTKRSDVLGCACYFNVPARTYEVSYCTAEDAEKGAC